MHTMAIHFPQADKALQSFTYQSLRKLLLQTALPKTESLIKFVTGVQPEELSTIHKIKQASQLQHRNPGEPLVSLLQ